MKPMAMMAKIQWVRDARSCSQRCDSQMLSPVQATARMMAKMNFSGTEKYILRYRLAGSAVRLPTLSGARASASEGVACLSAVGWSVMGALFRVGALAAGRGPRGEGAFGDALGDAPRRRPTGPPSVARYSCARSRQSTCGDYLIQD